MTKKLCKACISLFILLGSTTLTGCWDATEIDQLAIVTATGVDIVPHPSGRPTYNFTLQMARTSQLGTGEGGGSGSETGKNNTFIIIGHEGTDPLISLEHMRLQIARKIIMSHRRAVILGEPYAKYGITTMLDQIVRSPDLRMNAYMLVAYHDCASEIVKLPFALNRIPSDAFQNLNQMTPINKSTARNFIQELSGKGDPWLPGIERVGLDSSSEKNTFTINHVAVFQKDKMVGWLNNTDSKGLNWLTDNVKSDMLSVELSHHIGTIDGQIIKSKTTRHIQIVSGKPVLNIIINANAEIVTTGTKLNFRNPGNIHLVEHAFEANITNIAESALKRIQQQYDADIIGAGDLIYQSHPRVWHRIEPNWRTEFSRLPVHIDVKVRIQNSGTITSSTTNIEKW